MRDEEMHITITSLSLDDMTKIWSTFPNKPFRTSVCYVVTPVRIDSEQEYGCSKSSIKRSRLTPIWFLRKGEK